MKLCAGRKCISILCLLFLLPNSESPSCNILGMSIDEVSERVTRLAAEVEVLLVLITVRDSLPISVGVIVSKFNAKSASVIGEGTSNNSLSKSMGSVAMVDAVVAIVDDVVAIVDAVAVVVDTVVAILESAVAVKDSEVAVLDTAVVVMDSAVAVVDTVVELEVLTDGWIVPPCADTLIMVPFCFSFFGFDLVGLSVVLLSPEYNI